MVSVINRVAGNASLGVLVYHKTDIIESDGIENNDKSGISGTFYLLSSVKEYGGRMMNGLKAAIFIVLFGAFYSVPSVSAASEPQTDVILLADGEIPVNRRGILNGQKGYRYHRPGYRRHTDGWWYPQKAFDEETANGAEGGKRKADKALAKKLDLPAVHVRWCQENYRSYRVEDNTFQPYEGDRKPCRSAFWRKDQSL